MTLRTLTKVFVPGETRRVFPQSNGMIRFFNPFAAERTQAGGSYTVRNTNCDDVFGTVRNDSSYPNLL